jgi:hypothetical protein
LGAVGLILVDELRDALSEVFNVDHEFVVDGRLGGADFVLLVVGKTERHLPVVVDLGALGRLSRIVLDLEGLFVLVNRRIHFADRYELEAHFLLLVTDLSDFLLNADKCLDVVVFAVNAHAHGFDLLSDEFKVALGLVEHVLAEFFLDGFERIVDALLNVIVVERDCANGEVGRLRVDFELQLVEHVKLRGAQDRSAVLELALEVDHVVLRFILVLLFELCAGHLADVEFIGAFDVTGEEQDDSHDFLVSHDLLVKRLLLGLLFVVLFPVSS